MKSDKTTNILRWIAFIPLAIISAWIAWVFINILGKFTPFYSLDGSGSFLIQLTVETFGHAAMGGTFIYIGTKVVPSHKLIVSNVLVSLGLLFGGVSFFFANSVENGWAMWGSVCLSMGIAIMIYSIHKGETDIKI